MAESLGEALLRLRTDDTSFTRGIDKAETQTRRLGRVFDDVGRRAQRLGRQLATFVTLPILAIGAASVKTASDIQEMQNLFDVTFGNAADGVEAWASRTANAMKRSRFDLQKTASEFAAFLKPLGVADEAIVPMSKALTELTTDIASFRNQTDEEVFTRLFSGLAGETEAVRRLGIDIGQAALKQELLNLGFKGGIESATQAQKVMARFSLIIKQTSDAQGDAIRTSGSFENQTKALGATITDLRVEIGQRLLPVATRMVQKLRDLGQWFLGLSENTKSGVIAVVAFVAVIGPAIFALGLISRAVGFAIKGLAFFGPVLKFVAKAFLVAFKGIRFIIVRFVTFFFSVPALIIGSLAALIGGVFIFKETLIGFFKGLIQALKKEFIAGFNNKIVRPFQEAINSLISFLPDSVIETLGLKPLEVSDIIDNNFSDDMALVMAEATANGKREFESFKTSAIAAVDTVKGKFAELGGAISDFIPDLEMADFSLENIGTQFDALLASFGPLKNGLSGVGNAAEAAGEAGSKSWERFGETISDSMESNLTDALTRFQSFGDAAKSILNEVLSAFIRIGIVRPLLGAIGLPITGFAGGGRPPVGQPSIVGERGAELFVPDRAGTIIPNNQLGMGGGFSQTNNFGMVFPPQLEAFIRNVAGPAGREGAAQILNARRGRF